MVSRVLNATARVPTAQGKWGNWKEKKSLSGKTQGIWKFCKNTGNLVCSSCKFPDSKSKRYFGIAAKISKLCLKLDTSAKSVLSM